MSAFNVVKFRVKSGAEKRFVSAHHDGPANSPSLARGTIVHLPD